MFWISGVLSDKSYVPELSSPLQQLLNVNVYNTEVCLLIIIGIVTMKMKDRVGK